MTLSSLLGHTVHSLWHRPPVLGDASRLANIPELANVPPDVRRLIRDRRYCKVLAADAELPFDDASIACAWKSLEHDMALVPAGEIFLASNLVVATQYGLDFVTSAYDRVPVESVYVDRCCVTNADFARFVGAGGYSNVDLWPGEVLPNVLHFVDATGQPGPRYWRDGKPPADKLDHPVVGVSWYEANAYARWAAKRLATTAEWQRAGTWPMSHKGERNEPRYPWGNGFDPQKANLLSAGKRGTVPVYEFPLGRTLNGVQQLIGNVWEWVDTPFVPEADGGVRGLSGCPLAEIRGGAFDTYFHSQATCQFRSGHPLLHRGANVGFRCCISEEHLCPHADSPPHSQEPAKAK